MSKGAHDTRHRRRLLKWLAACVLVLLVAAAALFWLLPTLLSSPAGTRVLLSWFSARIPGAVEAQSLQLSWSAGQTVEGLTLLDRQGRPLFAVDSMEAPAVSLWSLLRGDRELGPIRIVRPTGRLDALVRLSRRPRRTRPGSPRQPGPSPRIPPAPRRRSPRLDNLRLALQVEEADLLLGVGATENEPLRLRIPRFNLDATDPSRVALSCRLELAAGERHGALDADLLLSDMFDARGTVRRDKVRVEGTVVASDVHVGLLDELAGLDGLLAAQVGPQAGGRLEVAGALHQLAGVARIQSDRLDIEARWRRSGSVVLVEPSSTLRWHWDGPAWDRLARRLGLPGPPRLLEPFHVEFRPANLSIPVSSRGVRWTQAAIDGQFRVGDVKLDGGGRVGQFRLLRGTLQLLSQRAGEQMDMQMSCLAERDGRRSRLAAHATVANPADRRRARAKLEGSVSDVPAALFDVLGGGAAAIAGEVVGPLLDVSFASTWQPAAADRSAAVNFEVVLEAQNLDARFEGRFDQPARQVQGGGEINVTLSPDSCDRLHGRFGEHLPAALQTATLAAPIQVRAKLEDIAVPLGSPGPSRWSGSVRLSAPVIAWKGFDPLPQAAVRDATLSVRRSQGASFDAALEATRLSFHVTGAGDRSAVKLHDVRLHVGGHRNPGALNVKLTGAVLTDGEDSTRVSMPFASESVLDGCFDTSGRLRIEGGRIDTSTALSGVPVDLIDALVGMEGRLAASIGATAAVKVEGQVPGHARILVGNDIVQIPVHVVTRRHEGRWRLALADDVEATFLLTKRSSRALFGSVHPIFNDAVESTAPMRLLVRKQPFHLPLGRGEMSRRPERITLDATLQIGTLKMDRRGWLTEGLDELTSVASNAVAHVHADSDSEQARTYLARFTPIHVTVADGMLRTDEFWVVSEDLSIGFQGASNLVRGDYRIFMGLLGASLIHQEPYLIHFVDPTNVYDIPIEGSVGSDPRIIKDDFALALTGSTAKRLVGLLGNQAQKLFEDTISRPIQQKQRSNLGGLDWHLPQPAREFIVRVLRTGAERSGDQE